METLRIDILNPKVKEILNNLAELKLIKISSKSENLDFSELLTKLRGKFTDQLSLEEIQDEVKLVRENRYGQ